MAYIDYILLYLLTLTFFFYNRKSAITYRNVGTLQQKTKEISLVSAGNGSF